jgi:hypothetical protein
MTRVVHVLVGTYDLMVFRNLSAQLSRLAAPAQASVICLDITLSDVIILSMWFLR